MRFMILLTAFLGLRSTTAHSEIALLVYNAQPGALQELVDAKGFEVRHEPALSFGNSMATKLASWAVRICTKTSLVDAIMLIDLRAGKVSGPVLCNPDDPSSYEENAQTTEATWSSRVLPSHVTDSSVWLGMVLNHAYSDSNLGKCAPSSSLYDSLSRREIQELSKEQIDIARLKVSLCQTRKHEAVAPMAELAILSKVFPNLRTGIADLVSVSPTLARLFARYIMQRRFGVVDDLSFDVYSGNWINQCKVTSAERGTAIDNATIKCSRSATGAPHHITPLVSSLKLSWRKLTNPRAQNLCSIGELKRSRNSDAPIIDGHLLVTIVSDKQYVKLASIQRSGPRLMLDTEILFDHTQKYISSIKMLNDGTQCLLWVEDTNKKVGIEIGATTSCNFTSLDSMGAPVLRSDCSCDAAHRAILRRELAASPQPPRLP